MDNFNQEIASSVAKVSPPAGVSMWLTIGGHVDDWIKIATLVYIVVQITALLVGKYLIWTGKYVPKGKGDE